MGTDASSSDPARLYAVLLLGSPLHMGTLRRFVRMADALGIIDSANILQMEDGEARALTCVAEGEPPESLTLRE